MDYISAAEAAALWGISGRMINYYCMEGRIPGAQKIGGTWIIPKDASKPEDRRKKASHENGPSGGCSDAKTKGL
ncbi:MAG: helix-turn-helix domain-containing protein [Clostridiaceae bacterium]